MTGLDENQERQVIRAIHGELADDEVLAYNRELLRDPQLRQAHDAYLEIHRLATESLGSLLSSPLRGHPPWVETAEPARSPARPGVQLVKDPGDSGRRFRRRLERWFLPLAAAAALLIAVVFPARPPAVPRFDPSVVSVPVTQSSGTGVSSLNRTVGTVPSHIQRRNTQRDVIGVIGKDGRYYILELDRTQAVKGQRIPRPLHPAGGV